MAKTVFPFANETEMWKRIGFFPGSWRIPSQTEIGTIQGLPSSGIALAVDQTRLLLLEPDGSVTLHHKDNFIPIPSERGESERTPKRAARASKPKVDITKYV